MRHEMGATLAWVFRSRADGTITIVQAPNLTLGLFIVATILRWAARPSGRAGTALRGLATGALAAWATDELVRGVNPWRRALGGGTLVWQAVVLADRLEERAEVPAGGVDR